MAIRGVVLAIETSLTPQLVIEVTVPSQEGERSCICIRGIHFVSFYDLSIEFWNCSDSVVYFDFKRFIGLLLL